MMGLIFFFLKTSSMCYNILLKKPEGLHIEARGTRPLNFKLEGFDLKIAAYAVYKSYKNKHLSLPLQ
jgi:hypothetical protein